MTQADLVIRGGKVVSPDSVIEASVAIKDGLVLAVGADAAMPQARESLDAKGMHVLPGAIDVHVHFRDPGYPHKEDFASGTIAAAFGGVTTVFDMPNTIPPTGNAEILAAKHKIAASKAHVDFGLYGLLGEETIAQVPELIAGGVIGFKLYMGNTFGAIPTPSTGAMLEAFEVVAPTGKRISLHAETNSIMERRQTRLTGAGRHDALAHIASRPAVGSSRCQWSNRYRLAAGPRRRPRRDCISWHAWPHTVEQTCQHASRLHPSTNPGLPNYSLSLSVMMLTGSSMSSADTATNPLRDFSLPSLGSARWRSSATW